MRLTGVAKFGGSSVADYTAILRCAEIIKKNSEYKVIVISATSKTTNHLEYLATLAKKDVKIACDYFFKEILDRHIELAHRLDVLTSLEISFDKISKEVFSLVESIHAEDKTFLQNMDQLYSIGERLSTLIFSSFLKIFLNEKKTLYLDSRDILKTDLQFSRATPNVEKIKEYYNRLNIPEDVIIITSGFIGESLCGLTTTLGREGSDYSASLFSEMIKAKFLHIWTDVPGVASMDPRQNENVRYIEHLCYDSATLLAESGAKILFPKTLLPVKRNSIPIWVKSSLDDEKNGTLIDGTRSDIITIYTLAIKDFDQIDSCVSIIGKQVNNTEVYWSRLLANVRIKYCIIDKKEDIVRFKVKKDNAKDFTRYIHNKIFTNEGKKL